LWNHGIQFGIALELAAGNVFAVLVDIQGFGFAIKLFSRRLAVSCGLWISVRIGPVSRRGI
jgi:hypothetical protein